MYTAIMKIENGRVAKYQDFETETEAKEHVEKFSGTYPQAFVLPTPNYPLVEWEVDVVSKAVTQSPVMDKIEASIHAHANGLVDSQTPPEGALLTLMKSILIVNKKTDGRATIEEKDTASALEKLGSYIEAVRDKEKEAIANLPNLTKDELLNFNVKTDIAWP